MEDIARPVRLDEPEFISDSVNKKREQSEKDSVEYGTFTVDNVNHSNGDFVAGEKSTQDANSVALDGPDDPENPLNWSAGKKYSAIAVISILTFLSPFTSTMISNGSAAVLQDFHSDSGTVAAFITSIYLLGYVFGPLLIAPLSELYGRKIMYQFCSTFFIVFNIACAVANGIAALLIFRFLTGIFGACPITIGAGSIADMIPKEKRGAAMALWALGSLLGPSIGPIISRYLVPAKGWRWDFWLISIVSASPTAATFLILRESYPAVILKRKARRLRKLHGNEDIQSLANDDRSKGTLIGQAIVRPLKMLFMSSIVLLLSLYMAIVYGYLYLCFTTYLRVFQAQYGFSSGSVGLVYLGIGVGSFLGVLLCGAILDSVVTSLTKKNGGESKPEYRLPVLMIGALLIPIGLFLYAWTAEYQEQWILPIIGTSFLGGGMVIAYVGEAYPNTIMTFSCMEWKQTDKTWMATLTYLVDAFATYAASAIAASTVFRSLLGALLPLAGNSMYNALSVGWGTSLLGFIAVAFIHLPFILYKYGERIRLAKAFQVVL